MAQPIEVRLTIQIEGQKYGARYTLTDQRPFITPEGQANQVLSALVPPMIRAVMDHFNPGDDDERRA